MGSQVTVRELLEIQEFIKNFCPSWEESQQLGAHLTASLCSIDCLMMSQNFGIVLIFEAVCSKSLLCCVVLLQVTGKHNKHGPIRLDLRMTSIAYKSPGYKLHQATGFCQHRFSHIAAMFFFHTNVCTGNAICDRVYKFYYLMTHLRMCDNTVVFFFRKDNKLYKGRNSVVKTWIIHLSIHPLTGTGH